MQKKQTTQAQLTRLGLLSSDIQTTMRIARAVHRAGMPIPAPLTAHASGRDPGFLLDEDGRPVAIGLAAGAAPGLAIDENGRPFQPGREEGQYAEPGNDRFSECAERFLGGFRLFEKKVSDYIETLAMAG